jgi:hypothetical protein
MAERVEVSVLTKWNCTLEIVRLIFGGDLVLMKFLIGLDHPLFVSHSIRFKKMEIRS